METVRGAIRAFNEDLAAGRVGRQLRDYIDDEVEWHAREEPKPLHGSAAVLASLREWLAIMEQIEFTPHEFMDRGNHVVVQLTSAARGRGSGVEVREPLATVWTLKGDKVVAYREYSSMAEALEASNSPD